jgi:uncharacterized protein (DUF1330 family)
MAARSLPSARFQSRHRIRLSSFRAEGPRSRATLYTHADTGPVVFEIYENNVTDEAAYKAALPEAIKFVKDNGGEYLAGGFNKTKLMHGKRPVGNRFVVIRYPNEAAQMKAQTDGLKAWIEKNAPEARDIAAQVWEMK